MSEHFFNKLFFPGSSEHDRSRPVLSFEFFPPKTTELFSDTKKLMADLVRYRPEFMTCTWGAGGGTKALTVELASYIRNELDCPAVAHLTCGGHSVAELDQVLERFSEQGVTNVLALRGDPPKGTSEFIPHLDGFSCAAELIDHLKKKGGVSIAAAAYPEGHRDAVRFGSELDYLKRKVDAGAELLITQLFFDSQFYFRFCDQVHSVGINVPILPGIMPIGNVAQVQRFTTMCGASLPQALKDKLDTLAPDQVQEFGIDFAVSQCKELISGGAPGIHFYTLNRSAQITPIVEAVFGSPSDSN